MNLHVCGIKKLPFESEHYTASHKLQALPAILEI